MTRGSQYVTPYLLIKVASLPHNTSTLQFRYVLNMNLPPTGHMYRKLQSMAVQLISPNSLFVCPSITPNPMSPHAHPRGSSSREYLSTFHPVALSRVG